MTILPRKSSFASGLAGGAAEGLQYLTMDKLRQQSFQKALQGFREYFQGGAGQGGAGIGGATQPNPQAVFGEPGAPMVGAPSQMMGGGGQLQQQNPLMRMLQGLGGRMGQMGQGVGGLLQKLLGGRQQTPGAPTGMMPGQGGMMGPLAGGQQGGMGPLAGGQGGIDPRIMAIIQQLLGGRMGMF